MYTHNHTHTCARTTGVQTCEFNALQSRESLCSWFHAWFGHSLRLVAIGAVLAASSPAKSTEPGRNHAASLPLYPSLSVSDVFVPPKVSSCSSGPCQGLVFVCNSLLLCCKHARDLPRSDQCRFQTLPSTPLTASIISLNPYAGPTSQLDICLYWTNCWSVIPVCANNSTIGTLPTAHKSSGAFSRSHERLFRPPVLKSSASKVAHQPRSSTPHSTRGEQIFVTAVRGVWGGGVEGCGVWEGVNTADRQGERRRKARAKSRSPERVPVLHSTESPPACQWEDSPAAAAAAAAAAAEAEVELEVAGAAAAALLALDRHSLPPRGAQDQAAFQRTTLTSSNVELNNRLSVLVYLPGLCAHLCTSVHIQLDANVK